MRMSGFFHLFPRDTVLEHVLDVRLDLCFTYLVRHDVSCLSSLHVPVRRRPVLLHVLRALLAPSTVKRCTRALSEEPAVLDDGLAARLVYGAAPWKFRLFKRRCLDVNASGQEEFIRFSCVKPVLGGQTFHGIGNHRFSERRERDGERARHGCGKGGHFVGICKLTKKFISIFFLQRSVA